MSLTLAQPTAGKLLSSVRDLLNQPNASNSFWTDQELLSYINEGIRIYFAEVSTLNEGQFTKIGTMSITANAETIALPSDCFEVKSLQKVVSTGYIPLKYDTDVTKTVYTQGGASGDTYLPCYYFRENAIALNPIPQYTETNGLRIEYVYFPDVMSIASDAMPSGVTPIFKQVIEMYAVYKAKLKESLVNGVDTSVLAKQNLNELTQQFREVIVNRSKYPVFVIPFNTESDF